jgi:hypothetical protein
MSAQNSEHMLQYFKKFHCPYNQDEIFFFLMNTGVVCVGMGDCQKQQLTLSLSGIAAIMQHSCQESAMLNITSRGSTT